MKKEKDFYQISLKIILKDKDGKILGLNGAKAGTYDGYYDLPGGRIDVDEFETPFLNILSRELREEIGVSVKFKIYPVPVAIGRHRLSAKFCSDNKEKHILYVLFEADYLGGKLKISKEHTGYKWLDLSKVELTKYFKSGNLEGIQMHIGK